MLFDGAVRIMSLAKPDGRILKSMAKKLADSKDKIDDFMLCDHIEKRVPVLLSELSGKDVILPANVDLYSGFVYEALDIPIDIATPLFASSRLSGWCAHRLEELSNDSKLMRPAFLSVQEKQNYVTLGDRKSNFL